MYTLYIYVFNSIYFSGKSPFSFLTSSSFSLSSLSAEFLTDLVTECHGPSDCLNEVYRAAASPLLFPFIFLLGSWALCFMSVSIG